MPRRFRLWEKKRGDRRTGSRLLGSVQEALFFVLLFALGATSLATLLVSLATGTWPAREYFPETQYVETECRVESSFLHQRQRAGLTPEFRPEVLILYKVDDKNYLHETAWAYSTDQARQQEIVDSFVVGQRYPCWYDPQQPTRAVLRQRLRWELWLTLLVLVSFVMIGGGGLLFTVLHVGTSQERRASLARRAANLDLIHDMRDQPATPRDLPNVPSAADLTNSPGVHLAYRLPTVPGSGWRLLVAAVFCLLWNGTSAALVAMAATGYVSGRPDWFLTIFTIPFLVIGVWSIYYLLKELVQTTWLAPPNVEISDHPLLPGGHYELYLSLSGRMSIESLTALLVCDEATTYRQGTDIRHDVQRVHRSELFQRKRLEVYPGTSLEQTCQIEIPPRAMHSFLSDHNSLQWKILVECRIAQQPLMQRSFPVVVYPVRQPAPVEPAPVTAPPALRDEEAATWNR